MSVNSPNWSPRSFQDAPLRYFQRPDGIIFPLPASEDYHIDRVLKEGWREVSSAQGDAPPAPPAPAVPDTRDAEIAALRAELERVKAAKSEEPTDAPAPDDAAAHPRSAGFNRRSR